MCLSLTINYPTSPKSLFYYTHNFLIICYSVADDANMNMNNYNDGDDDDDTLNPNHSIPN